MLVISNIHVNWPARGGGDEVTEANTPSLTFPHRGRDSDAAGRTLGGKIWGIIVQTWHGAFPHPILESG